MTTMKVLLWGQFTRRRRFLSLPLRRDPSSSSSSLGITGADFVSSVRGKSMVIRSCASIQNEVPNLETSLGRRKQTTTRTRTLVIDCPKRINRRSKNDSEIDFSHPPRRIPALLSSRSMSSNASHSWPPQHRPKDPLPHPRYTQLRWLSSRQQRPASTEASAEREQDNSQQQQQQQQQEWWEGSNEQEEGQIELRCNVFAMGENWTGAFGTGKLDQVVRGHLDETDDVAAPLSVFDGTLTASVDESSMDSVSPSYTSSALVDLPSISAGWGHSAICAGDQLLLAGQPHDWYKLLRYKRIPPFLAKLATRFEAIPKTTIGQALSRIMRNENERENFEKQINQEMLPVPLAQARENVPMEVQKVDDTRDRWHLAEYYSFMYDWTNMPLPEPPVKVQCSAGLSGVLGISGRLYGFGQNHWGQCGTGILTASNIWVPEYPVVKSIADDVVDDFHLRLGDGTSYNPNNNMALPLVVKAEEEYEHDDPYDVLFLIDFALGLQHGIGLDAAGRVYCWGKAKNGQLGQFQIWDDSAAALRVSKYATLTDYTIARPTYHPLEPVQQVAAGMLHCAALSTENQVYVWGKNVLPPLPRQREKGIPASDSKVPFQIPRETLPDRPIVQIACGSHHTAMLFDDGSVYAVGITTDTRRPIGLDTKNGMGPVQLFPPGSVDGVRYFTADMDRTTLIGESGRQLLQAQLWHNPELQRQAIFTPTWVDSLLQEHPHTHIEEIHRSWVHSLVLTTTPLSPYSYPYSSETEESSSEDEAESSKGQERVRSTPPSPSNQDEPASEPPNKPQEPSEKQ